MPVYKRGDIYYIDTYISGRRIRKSAGKKTTRAQAQAIERKLHDDALKARTGQKPDRSLSESLVRWLDHELPHLKNPKKFESHARALIPFVRGKTLHQAPDAAEDYKRIKSKENLAPATINRRLAILRRICNLAYKSWDWIDQPIGEKITLLPERNERHVYLTPKQVKKLSRACDNKNAKKMIMLAAYTGLRRGELFRLTRENLMDGCIVLDAQTKNGRPRVIPIPKEARKIARKLPLELSDAQLRRQWDKAREKTGLNHIRFHDLRHTYASWLVQSNVPMRAVQELLGHTTITTTQRYAHLSTEHLKAAVSKISKS